jgi:hypothetical protein
LPFAQPRIRELVAEHDKRVRRGLPVELALADLRAALEPAGDAVRAAYTYYSCTASAVDVTASGMSADSWRSCAQVR